MGMTMTQKILAAHAGLDHVEAGQLIEAQLDLVLGNDITSPVAIHEMDKMTVDTVFDKDKIALVMDHFIPNKDIKSAEHCKCVREFACRHDITNYFDVGQMGIEHALLPEKGLTVAGDVIIGADSHTCTYGALGAFSTGVGSTDMAAGMATGKAWFKVPSAIKFNIVGKPKKWVSGKDVILHIIGMIGVDGALYKSMEFVGEGIKNLSMDDRFTIANMAIEAGGKNGIFPVDDLAIEYMKEHSKRPYTAYEADEDAVYEAEYTIDLSTLEPTVAFPHLPENTKTISEIGEPVVVDQSVIGSCTNGRIDDLRVAARILKGRKVKKGLRCIVIPATQAIYLQAMEEGLLKIFIEAGAVVSTPTCGPCLGGYMGILAAGERCISTTNRNFVGRMGHVESEVYLASPAVAAASAVTGYICAPEEFMQAKGRAFKYGDNVDTDVIIPARYLNSSDPAELATHCMEDIDNTFVKRVQKGDIIVATKNFGCGSSREHAPIAIKAAGVSCVIAETFARIFYRNAINIGLPIIECPEASKGIDEGDEVEVDFDSGMIYNRTKGTEFKGQAFPEFMQKIIKAEGLVNYINAQH